LALRLINNIENITVSIQYEVCCSPSQKHYSLSDQFSFYANSITYETFNKSLWNHYHYSLIFLIFSSSQSCLCYSYSLFNHTSPFVHIVYSQIWGNYSHQVLLSSCHTCSQFRFINTFSCGWVGDQYVSCQKDLG